jgi:hypothetical protein
MVSGNREKEPNMTTDSTQGIVAFEAFEALELQIQADAGIARAQHELAQSVAALDVGGVNFWADSLKFWVDARVNPKNFV